MNYKYLQEYFFKTVNYDIDELKNNVKVVNYSNLGEIIDFVGVFKIIEHNIIKDYKLLVPEIKDLKSLLINIHEYTHLLMIKNQIGKKDYYDIYEEVFPITMERIFIQNFSEKEINSFNLEQLKKLKYYINSQNYNKNKYIIAYYYQFILYEIYKNNISNLFNHKFNERIIIDDIVEKTIKLLKNNSCK